MLKGHILLYQCVIINIETSHGRRIRDDLVNVERRLGDLVGLFQKKAIRAILGMVLSREWRWQLGEPRNCGWVK